MPSDNKKDLFPHELVREGQEDLIKDIEKALAERKIILAHAPTGLGKTASALAVALSWALEKNKKIFFLTNRHTQHKIAVDTLKLIRNKHGADVSCIDLIGKRWMCNQEVAGLFGGDFNEFCKTIIERGECEFYNNVKAKRTLTVEAKKLIQDLKNQGPLHNEEVIHLSKEVKMCGYEVTLELAKNAKVIIGDYYYLFNPFVQSTLFNKMDLEIEDVILIVDEGHNLPGRIMDMMSSNLTSNIIKNAILEAKKYGYKGLIIWLQELMKILNELTEFDEKSFVKEKLVEKEVLISKINEVVDYDEFINELELAADEVRKKQRKSYLGGISSFLDSWKGEDKGFVRIISEKIGKYGPLTVLSYSCLDPRIISEDIFKKVYSGIIMSGTLKPTFMYKDILGINKALEKEYFSPFPSENKLSLIIPETSTKYNLRGEAMFRNIADKCSEITSLIPGNVAFFFPSYKLRDNISAYFTSKKKLFWEKQEMSKEEKEIFLAGFKAEKEKGGVLLGVAGANFAEGVDFPGDLLQGVVVVGLPLAHPNLKTKEIIKYYDEKFNKGWDYGYIFPAISKCIQSAGRCIRSETDKGAVIFLDERFAWQNYYNCLPREGLIVSKEYQKLLKNFFS
ncbi:MAG: ATP-dependent DNA helicase [Nanoarchaeota archaeon]|nr:ATP-dependent DNA helicase [Nanoarchaeota archaeon]MBU1644210.1 ATP-dependent DNA helicase [Nanoarchaeota archaeon]MBU1976731.1 ATP-dependent DNA helicase [Nanoarchaeota archaeon]